MELPLPAIMIATGLLFGAGYFFGITKPTEDGGPGTNGRSDITSQTNARPISQRPLPANVTAKDSLAGLSHSGVKQRTLAALSEPDRILRWEALMKVLAGMNETNAVAISEALTLRHSTGANTRSEGEMIQFREGQVLREAGMKELPAEPNGKPGYAAMHKMRGWASVDPKSAKAWLDSLEPGRAKVTLLGKWQEGLSEASSKVLEEIFPSLPADQQRSVVGNIVNGLLNEGGFPAVRSWYDSNANTADPVVLSAAFSDIVGRMTQDPQQWDATVAFIKSQTGRLDMSALDFSTINRRMAHYDPGKCLELLQDLSLTSTAIQARVNSIISDTIEKSTSSSPNNLGSWLNEHKNHPLYDQTVQQFAQRTRSDDLDSALRWAGTIKDETLRLQTLAKLQSQ